MAEDEVLVVGGGIAGVSCARTLADAGLPVVLRDRGRRIGGRMAVRTLAGRPVDVGASYFTVDHPVFAEQVKQWEGSGLARRWTDTFHVGTPDGLTGTTSGPVRYASPLGLRSLVEDLAVGLPVTNPDEVGGVGPGPVADDQGYAAVVLAMPGPQAMDLLATELDAERRAADRMYEPSLSLVARWHERLWRELDGVFVNDSPVLRWIADDGMRRGDGAPVLVAHSDPVLAAAHLDDPASAAATMLDELSAVMGVSEPPVEHFVMRWSLAKPVATNEQPFHLTTAKVGLCGDGWHGRARIESAFLSGRALGRALVQLLQG